MTFPFFLPILWDWDQADIWCLRLRQGQTRARQPPYYCAVTLALYILSLWRKVLPCLYSHCKTHSSTCMSTFCWGKSDSWLSGKDAGKKGEQSKCEDIERVLKPFCTRRCLVIRWLPIVGAGRAFVFHVAHPGFVPCIPCSSLSLLRGDPWAQDQEKPWAHPGVTPKQNKTKELVCLPHLFVRGWS